MKIGIDMAVPGTDDTIIAFKLSQIREFKKIINESLNKIYNSTAPLPCVGECREGDMCPKCEAYSSAFGDLQHLSRNLYNE